MTRAQVLEYNKWKERIAQEYDDAMVMCLLEGRLAPVVSLNPSWKWKLKGVQVEDESVRLLMVVRWSHESKSNSKNLQVENLNRKELKFVE